jgi:hypothetical protein
MFERTGTAADQQARSAYDLKKVWGDGLDLKMVDDAGHSAKEPGIRKLLVEVSVSNARGEYLLTCRPLPSFPACSKFLTNFSYIMHD